MGLRSILVVRGVSIGDGNLCPSLIRCEVETIAYFVKKVKIEMRKRRFEVLKLSFEDLKLECNMS